MIYITYRDKKNDDSESLVKKVIEEWKKGRIVLQGFAGKRGVFSY